jgi:hypothetical protein
MSWSIQRKRATVAIAGAPLLFCLFNYYADLHFFGAYDLTAVVICTAVVFVLVNFFGPTLFKNNRDSSTAQLDEGKNAK